MSTSSIDRGWGIWRRSGRKSVVVYLVESIQDGVVESIL